MLNRIAQPTSRPRLQPEGAFGLRLSAAGGWLLATIAVLLTLATPDGAAAADGGSGAWPWPLLGEVITPYKNGSDRYAAGQHRGLDIAAPAGTPVRAIVDGRVTFAGTLPDGGVTVTMRSGDGAYLVSDLHLASRAVSRGASVAAGETLGAVGTTGRRSTTQPHLHLSVRRASDRAYLDPMGMLGPQRVAKSPAKPAPKVHLTAIEPKAQSINSVHAHATGDTTSTTRHGAGSRRTTADRSVDARAREGHAARHVSRVAPPPLKQPDSVRARDTSVSAVTTEATPVAARPPAASAQRNVGGASRLLLLAVAAVCLVALAMRQKAVQTVRAIDPPPVDSSAASEDEAKVIQLHRAS